MSHFSMFDDICGCESDSDNDDEFEEFELGSQHKLGEALFYDQEQKSLWGVDILGHKIFCYKEPIKQMIEWKVSIPLPSCVIPINNTNKLLVTGGTQIFLWNPENNTQEVIYDLAPELNESDKKTIRFNDGKCDPYGRFWIGTLDIHDRPNKGGLYKMTCTFEQGQRNTTLIKKLDAGLSNGLGWNNDGSRFYYIDTLTKSLQVFAYDLAQGEIGNKLNQIDLYNHTGVPDGLTIDNRNKIWIAMWNGRQLINFDPDTDKKYIAGSNMRTIKLDIDKPTSCIITPNGVMYVSTSEGKLYHKHFTGSKSNHYSKLGQGDTPVPSDLPE